MLLLLTNGSKQHLKLPVVHGGCGCTTIFFHHQHGVPIHQYPQHRHSSTQQQQQQRLLPLRLSPFLLSSRGPLTHQIHCSNGQSILIPPLRQHPQLQRIHLPPPPKSTRYLTTTTTTTSTKHTNETTTTSSSSSRHVLLEHLTRKSDDETLKEDNDATPTKTISILTLNRPEAANAMGHQMIQELQECIEQIEQQLQPPPPSSLSSPTNTATRCVILTSASPRVFSAGADLKERSQMTIHQAENFVTKLRDTFHRLSQLPIPIIAAIEGTALGGGLELTLAADIRIASEQNAVLGLPETSLAIVPGAGGTQRLSRLMGIARAKEMIFTGQRIASRTAYQYGLIQHVVPDGTTLSFATDMAWTIASNGPVAIQAAKHAIDTGYECPNMRDALNIERIAYGRVLQSQDREEGLLAFKEKRKPHYKGR